ncbi:MAG: fasciclin domain-containing protein [Pseudolabrys sp.]
MHFHFATAVWGPWHTGVYLDANLPSLLADGNLPAFLRQHTVKYQIFTSAADARLISAHPAFKKASEFVNFEIVVPRIDLSSNPIDAHHYLWRRSLNKAREAGAMVLFVPPDVAWSNGALGHVADIASQGKKAIFMTYMRVVSEPCVAKLRERHMSADGVSINAASRELVRLAFEYIHPLTLTYLRDCENFPIHPEFILWRVPGEGYLMRVLVREMFAYDPNYIQLNRKALPAHDINPDDVHFITDSDDLFALSFAPLMKDVAWFSRRQRLNSLLVGSWWLEYDSPANNLVAGHHYYVHHGDRSAEAWRRAELQSDALINKLIGAREALRTYQSMTDDRVAKARELLAMALIDTRLNQFLHENSPVTVIIPKNAGLVQWLFERGEYYFNTQKKNDLARLLLDHVILGEIDLKNRRDSVLTTARGKQRRLTWDYRFPLIDDVPIQTESFSLANDWSHIVNRRGLIADAVLPPCSS